jgi:hypothetical protein
MDSDADPGGSKTYGSSRSGCGSGTLLEIFFAIGLYIKESIIGI